MFREAWEYDGVVAVMAAGIVVRKIAPLLRDKWSDPGVVVVDSAKRFAIALLGGHHGANDLAHRLSGLGIVPVVTTATESRGRPSVEAIARGLDAGIVNRESTKSVNLAMLERDVPVVELEGPRVVVVGGDVAVLRRRDVVVGVGAQSGVSSGEVLDAIHGALDSVDISVERVGLVATAEIKRCETGIHEAASELGVDVAFVSKDVINRQDPVSPSRAERLGLRGVAEPCALALSKNREIIMPKRVYGRVTVAIAR